MFDAMNMPNSLYVAFLDKKIKQNIKENEEAKAKESNKDQSSQIPPINPDLMEDELNDILEGGS